jgi:hypothetical protein
MAKEAPLQMDMFTGELVDNRTGTQKRKAREEEGPKQAEMFSQREMAQFGVKANPKLPISPKTRIELMIEDHRTEEEKAEAIQQEALQRNYRMFPEEDLVPEETGLAPDRLIESPL